MHFDDIDIPDTLIRAAQKGQLVIFAGAGVSKQEPTCLPDFDELVTKIRDIVDPGHHLKDRKRRQDGEGYEEGPERYLGYLASHANSGSKQVRSACARLLGGEREPSELHRNILSLFGNPESLRVVTTNFDSCFESAAGGMGMSPRIYISPALPLGNDFSGLIHLHGSTVDPNSQILTDVDFGRAYITDGWASHFLVRMFSTYKTLFIGYSCGDMLVDYLTRSLSADMAENAFALDRSDDGLSDWESRGVTPIMFSDYKELPVLFDRWSSYTAMSLYERSSAIEGLTSEPMGPAGLPRDSEEILLDSLGSENERRRTACIRTFCDHATGAGWLGWAYEHGLLECLFSDCTESQQNLMLEWATTFSCTDYGALESIALRRGVNSLSQRTCAYIIRELSNKKAPKECVASWLPFLENKVTEHDCRNVVGLMEEQDDDRVALGLARLLLTISPNVSTDYDATRKVGPMLPLGQWFPAERLEERMASLAKPERRSLWNLCCEGIERADDITTGYGTGSDVYSALLRATIEEDDEADGDRPDQTGIGTLVDVARETGLKLLEEVPKDAEALVKRCLSSHSELMVRLGIYLLYKSDLPAADKLGYVISDDLLGNIMLRHEAFLLLSDAYPAIAKDEKEDFISYVDSVSSRGGDERTNAYERFNAYSWLLRTVPDDAQLLEQVGRIKQDHPDFEERSHPDRIVGPVETLVVGSGPALNVEEFTFSAVQLVADGKPSADWTQKDRVVASVQKYPEKTLAMLREHIGSPDTTDIKTCAFLAEKLNWMTAFDTDQKECLEVLCQAVPVSELRLLALSELDSLIDCNGDRIDQQELNACSRAAQGEWGWAFERDPLARKDHDLWPNGTDWVTAEANHPVGKILGIYTHCLSFAAKRGLVQEARDSAVALFSRLRGSLAQDGDMGDVVRACTFRFFNILDELLPDGEVASSLLPLLEPDDPRCIPAWQGFAMQSKRLTGAVWDKVRRPYEGLFSSPYIDGNCYEGRLTALYMRGVLRYSDEIARVCNLTACVGGSSKRGTEVTRQLVFWLESADESMRGQAWSSWIEKLLDALRRSSDDLHKIVAETLSHCLGTLPELSASIISFLMGSPSTIEGSITLDDEALERVSSAPDVSPDEITWLISQLFTDYKWCSITEQRTIAVLSKLDLHGVRDGLIRDIRDASVYMGWQKLGEILEPLS